MVHVLYTHLQLIRVLIHVHTCTLCNEILFFILQENGGKLPGNIRPFERLTTDQMKEELRARQIYDFRSTKEGYQRETK